MPVPTSLATLSQTPASNSPAGSDAVFPQLDDYLREIYANAARLRDAAHQLLTSVSGVDTITASNAHIGAYVTGQSFVLPAAGANTGAVTLNINGLGAKAVTKNGATALAAGDIPAGRLMRLEYDGTRFQITGPVYRDFLSNLVGVAINDSGGSQRLLFNSASKTSIYGLASSGQSGIDLVVNGATAAQIKQGGTIAASADATLSNEVARLGQVQTMDEAVQSAAISAATSAATAAALASALGGTGQTYQNVTASRALATTYTNSTGRPILVLIGCGSSSSGDSSVAPVVDGVALPGVVVYGPGSGYSTPTAFIVPDGKTYSVTASNATLSRWVELR